MRNPPAWLPDDLVLLDARSPLPLDRPFTSTQARQLGVTRWFLTKLIARGLVREVVRGAYVAMQVRDSIETRAASLRLVVPESAVVTDRTAAWLLGVDALPRSAAYEPTPLDVFSTQDSRVRRPGVHSGVRMLEDRDVVTVDGVRVTSPVRTALDLGRLLPRYDAIAALDAFLRAGVPQEALLHEIDRFKGYRGVLQLRELAPLADPRAESAPESALRLHGLDAGLPPLEPQFWVCDSWGAEVYRLDLALPELCYGAEYYGERFHAEDDQEADESRVEWLDDHGWEIDVFRRHDVYGQAAHPGGLLRAGIARARRRAGGWVPQGKFL